MSVAATHSPADALCQALVDMGLGTDESLVPQQPWPVYVDGEPSSPDDCITVYDTAPQDDGRSMPDGEADRHFGFQIRVRAQHHPDCHAKAAAIHRSLNEDLYDRTVTIGGHSYTVWCAAKTSLLRLGKDSPSTKRSLYVINGFLAIQVLS